MDGGSSSDCTPAVGSPTDLPSDAFIVAARELRKLLLEVNRPGSPYNSTRAGTQNSRSGFPKPKNDGESERTFLPKERLSTRGEQRKEEERGGSGSQRGIEGRKKEEKKKREGLLYNSQIKNTLKIRQIFKIVV